MRTDRLSSLAINKKRQPEAALLAAGALTAGFLNGLLGAGGGVILVFLLELLYKPAGEKAKTVFTTSLCALCAVSLVSFVMYVSEGRAELSAPLPYLLPAAAGGCAGAWLLHRIPVRALKLLFALVVIWSGCYMLFS